MFQLLEMVEQWPAPFLILFSIVHSVFHQYGGPTWKYFFPCSADNAQDWQPYPVDLYSAIYDDHTYIIYMVHTYTHTQ